MFLWRYLANPNTPVSLSVVTTLPIFSCVYLCSFPTLLDVENRLVLFSIQRFLPWGNKSKPPSLSCKTCTFRSPPPPVTDDFDDFVVLVSLIGISWFFTSSKFVFFNEGEYSLKQGIDNSETRFWCCWSSQGFLFTLSSVLSSVRCLNSTAEQSGLALDSFDFFQIWFFKCSWTGNHVSCLHCSWRFWHLTAKQSIMKYKTVLYHKTVEHCRSMHLKCPLFNVNRAIMVLHISQAHCSFQTNVLPVSSVLYISSSLHWNKLFLKADHGLSGGLIYINKLIKFEKWTHKGVRAVVRAKH